MSRYHYLISFFWGILLCTQLYAQDGVLLSNEHLKALDFTLSPSEKFMVVAYEGYLELLDIKTNQSIKTIVEENVRRVYLSDDSSRLYLVYNTGSLARIDISSNKKIEMDQAIGQITCLKTFANGNLAFGTDKGLLRVIDKQDDLLFEARLNSLITGIQFDGNFHYIASCITGEVYTLNQSGEELNSIDIGPACFDISFIPQYNILMAGGQNKLISFRKNGAVNQDLQIDKKVGSQVVSMDVTDFYTYAIGLSSGAIKIISQFGIYALKHRSSIIRLCLVNLGDNKISVVALDYAGRVILFKSDDFSFNT